MTEDPAPLLALTVFVLAGCPEIKSGQRVRWSIGEHVMRDFDANEWEVARWTDHATGSVVFELREKVDAFGLPKSAYRALSA